MVDTALYSLTLSQFDSQGQLALKAVVAASKPMARRTHAGFTGANG